jgi:hypothetical protein
MEPYFGPKGYPTFLLRSLLYAYSLSRENNYEFNPPYLLRSGSRDEYGPGRSESPDGVSLTSSPLF